MTLCGLSISQHGTLWCVGSVLLALSLSGCARPKADTAAVQQPAPEPAAVTTVKPERKTMRRAVEQPGFLEAFEETPLFAKIAGYVRQVHVDIGDRVRKDDVLAELAVPEMEVELRQRDALVRQADAELKLAKDAVAVSEAELKRMKSQFERLERVGKSGVIDKETVEETQHGLEASKAKRDMARSDVGVKEARLEVAQANRDQSQAMLAYTKIRAPYDGVVVRRNIHTGHFLQPATGSAAQPLFIVASTDTLRVFLDVPEVDVLLIKEGVPARVRVQSIKDREFTGKVARTAWSVDVKARTLRAEIDLANSQGQLRPGMYAYVSITAEVPGRLTLPATAVGAQGEHSFCFRIEDGKAVRMPVRLGMRDASSVEVVKKQAKPTKPGTEGAWEDFTGDEVVIQGNLSTLADGQAVRVEQGNK